MSDTGNANNITLEKRGNAAVVRIAAKMLDDSGLRQLGKVIDDGANDPEVATVVIDLSNVQILPSLGLGALVQISTKCKARQQRMKLASVKPQIRQVLTITKMDRILELADSVEAALEG